MAVVPDAAPAAGTAPEQRARPSVTRSLFHSVLGVGGARVLGALSGILAARLLGPTLRGEFALALIIATCASMLATCGLQFWTATSVATHRSAVHVTSTVLRHCIALTLGVAAVALVAAPALGDLFGLDGASIAWMAAYAATNAALLLVLAVPNGDRAMGVVAVALTGGAFVFLAGVGALLVFGVSSVAWVLAFGTLGNVTSIAIALPTWRRLHRSTPATDAPELTWGPAVRTFLGSGVGELVFLGMLRVDLVVLALFVPMADVGLYAVATSYAEILWVTPDAVAQVALPLAAEPEGDRLVPRVFRLTMLLMVPIGLLMVAAAPLLVPLVFGADYRHAVAAIPLLIVASLFAAVWKILGGAVVARGRPSLRLWTAAAGLVTMLAADMALIPWLGIAGAAWATATGYATAAVAMVVAWQRLPGDPGESLWRFQRADLIELRRIAGRVGGRA